LSEFTFAPLNSINIGNVIRPAEDWFESLPFRFFMMASDLDNLFGKSHKYPIHIKYSLNRKNSRKKYGAE